MNEQAPVTAKEAFEQALPAILSGDLADLLGRCADDVIFEFPFAPDGRPRRLEGREQVCEYLDAVNSRLKIEGLTRPPTRWGVAAEGLFLRCKALMDAHAKHLATLEEIAGAVGIEPSSVCRLSADFKAPALTNICCAAK